MDLLTSFKEIILSVVHNVNLIFEHMPSPNLPASSDFFRSNPKCLQVFFKDLCIHQRKAIDLVNGTCFCGQLYERIFAHGIQFRAFIVPDINLRPADFPFLLMCLLISLFF